jgi:hypothetical protein
MSDSAPSLDPKPLGHHRSTYGMKEPLASVASRPIAVWNEWGSEDGVENCATAAREDTRKIATSSVDTSPVLC